MAEKTLTLKCGACGHENEPERVYCHNCGQKLDRSLLPTPEVRKEESPGEKHRQVKKMMQVGSSKNWFARDLKTALKILVFAVIIAALFLFWQKPDGIPEKSDEIPAKAAGEAWATLMDLKEGRQLGLSEDEINYFLKSAVKPSKGSVPGVDFERAYVNLHAGPDGTPGTITIITQRDAWGLKLYSSITLAPKEVDDTVRFDVIGVRFGRLAIHPSMKFLGELGMGGLKKAFEKEIEQASRLKSARPGEKVIALETNPKP